MDDIDNKPIIEGQCGLFRRIVENIDFSVTVTDLNGTIVYVNPQQCESSGYTCDELVGRNASVFQSGMTPKETFHQLWATILRGQTWHGELLNRRKNGEVAWERMSVSPIRGENGEIASFLAIKEEMQDHSSPGGQRALMDGLTGLPNRDTLLERLGVIISGAYTTGGGFALFFLDLDRFCTCNETMGPIATDQILLEVVSRLTATVRGDDLIARTGADEFVLVLRNAVDQTLCGEAATRILQALSRPMHIEGCSLGITGSIGIVRYPMDGRDAQGLLNNAVLAQASARQEGGDRFRFYDPLLQGGASPPPDIASQLRNVAERGELRLHYQPQVSLASGHMVGVEALVRWQHPERGLVPPGTFIPVAEETGLIIAIGEWVLREACRQARQWQDAGLPPLRVAVNLSARHFRFTSLPETVASVLAETGLEPKYLELELTESAMMQDPSKAVRVVDRLKSLGVRISLDDFGTGYSSLAYLSRFAIDRLKIDQSFVRDITSNPVNASIAVATIAMAHKLGKIVVAEGVETEAQMQFLRRHDCDEMQGFFFCKPMPADELHPLLQAGKHLSFGAPQPGAATNTVLLVDDEQNILNALRRLLRREGYHILTATGGAEALELLAVNPVQVIVSDQRMPGMSGVEFLSKVKELYPETVRISLSGYSEISTVTDAINKGAIWKYITKPWDDDALVQDIRAAFRMARQQP